ncbi:MAG TPA: TIGR04282 family arsenosugar biosynthesis glycosyltransferase [Candidatus Cybelea sp.]|nr:TIGR04282 family arsenosugar biosynthesis glycosyltransferase [Candidatus Cybelea sp.]
MRRRPNLIVFVKAPRRGQVKTRLARGIGFAEATRFYRGECFALLRRLGRDRRWTLWLAIAELRDMRSGFWPMRFARVSQKRGDLGARMRSAYEALPRGPAVIVGSDIPDANADRIASAFRALAGHDAVFGPASDGGYWLVGFRERRHVRRAFSGVRWSSAVALSDTLANLARMRVAMVDTLHDVDTPEDYGRWRRRTA